MLCAGLIGHRSYRMTEDAQKIGFYGFGAAAHILIQVANYQNKQVQANEALNALRSGKINGAAVLVVDDERTKSK